MNKIIASIHAVLIEERGSINCQLNIYSRDEAIPILVAISILRKSREFLTPEAAETVDSSIVLLESLLNEDTNIK